MQCRFCKTTLEHEFIDLFNAPASNSFLTNDQLNEPETYFPLKVFVCGKCFLVQVDEYESSESIFNNDYVYFSSFSTSWLEHAKEYVAMVIERFALNKDSQVIEIASNDGYLLQYFVEKSIPVLGIEPTKNTAEAAIKKGVKTITEFFGVALATKLASQGMMADLFLGNNVVAHVPDIVDLVAGMKVILKPGGVITLEFPHLVQLVENNQFDTIYHEHFSYLSFYTINRIFNTQGMELFDVEEIPTHGGSLRIFAKHIEDDTKIISPRVPALLNKEIKAGVTDLSYYTGFQNRALQVKIDLLQFLIQQKKAGKVVVAYGAAAKGNTLLNYSGVKADLIDFVVDASPSKQGKFLPASHIPVVKEEVLIKGKPDFVIILPWNIKDEITRQLSYIKEWGGKFVVFIPKLEIL
jgi:SAM-dependent methyltransferase